MIDQSYLPGSHDIHMLFLIVNEEVGVNFVSNIDGDIFIDCTITLALQRHLKSNKEKE